MEILQRSIKRRLPWLKRDEQRSPTIPVSSPLPFFHRSRSWLIEDASQISPNIIASQSTISWRSETISVVISSGFRTSRPS